MIRKNRGCVLPESNRITLPERPASLFLPIRYGEVFPNDTFLVIKAENGNKGMVENYDTKIISFSPLAAFI
ncbi:hypothetical protein BBI00_19700 [Chryseobacterium arthrosphaerae]|uniref:Uncharacterized protein n=1 Tax=Chryseobacterium arthrosphaerae TaxID=651561 RepID=A0A1B8ZEQ0_9FLAO|nr:hypothetical protein BBI00_19700 [Chryseobacterium arthrosphaerae]